MNSISNGNTFYLLDLDRTLFNTPLFTNEILALVAEYDVQVAQELSQNVEDAFRKGISFAIRAEISLRLGEEAAVKIASKILELVNHEALLLEGAEEVLTYVTETPEVAAGILTYGEPKGQAMKIQAANLQVMPHLITSVREKGALIDSWRHADGMYHLPVEYENVAVRNIALVDDRLMSFKGLPPDARGYWLSVEPPSASEVSLLAANVMVIRSLHEFVEAERHIDKT